MADTEETVDAPELDPSQWDEQSAVTGRPNDIGPEGPPANSTFAERARGRNKQQTAVTGKAEAEPVKKPAKRAAKKAG